MRQTPNFNGYESGVDFDRARSQIATPFLYVDIALDTQTSNSILNISGDFLYLDSASTGSVTIELNNQYSDKEAPFYASAGFGINATFKQLKLSWVAQPGKFVRFIYSTGDRVVPTNSVSIGGTVQIDATRGAFTNTQASITASSQAILAANSARKYLLIQNNDSAAILYVTFGATATAANGVKIPPGGNYELNSNIPSNSVNIIGSAITSNVIVVEGT